MDDKALVETIFAWRQRIDAEMEILKSAADDEKLPIFKALMDVNNSLVQLFWEIMIYRERHGLSVPLVH